MRSFIFFFNRADDASPSVSRRVIGGWRWEEGRQGMDENEERERETVARVSNQVQEKYVCQ